MALITVLLGLFAERFLGSLEELRRFEWFELWTDRVRGWVPAHEPWQETLALLLVLAVPFVLVTLFETWLFDVWLIFGFLFGLFILVYSFGPQDLEAQLEAFIDARERGDEESAQWHVAEVLGDRTPSNSRELTRAVMETIFVQAHERILGVIFWYVVLGPAGALLYRLSCLLDMRVRKEDDEFASATRRLHHILAWIPVRLTALAYALSGSFVDAMQYWREEALKWRDTGYGVLVSAGFGALRYEMAPADDAEVGLDDIRSALSLARRTAVLWVALLGLLTLAGWTG